MFIIGGKKIAAKCQSLLPRNKYFDGVFPISHWSGCGLIENSLGLEYLQRSLLGLALNPNIFGVIWVSLGCEDNQMKTLVEEQRSSTIMKYVSIQECGGTAETIINSIDKIKSIYNEIKDIEREELPVSKLHLGLNCGGSDSFSGITANPALGIASDYLIDNGATVVLAETPEIYGAEFLLTSDVSLLEKINNRFEWWQRYTSRFGGSMNSNPAPGNKSGGISTIIEKSLGAVAKAGKKYAIIDVLDYAQVPSDKCGLFFMDTPGYDPVSVSGLISGGANIVCFTTGRGSVFGAKPSPSIKLCSNSNTYNKMKGDMDINCGEVLEGASIQEMGLSIYRYILKVCSGEYTKSEISDIGEEEFIPWIPSPVM